MTDPKIHDAKEVEFYAAAVNAWLSTSLEHDKSLLTLSAGGIGLLVSLMSTAGLRSIESLILYIVALAAFLCCLIAILWIFKRNRTHLQNAIRETQSDDPLLAVLDNVAILSFLFGALLSAIIGVAAAAHSFELKESTMTNDSKTRQVANDSVNGILKIRPVTPDPLTKSFNGITNMKPAQQSSSQTQSQAAGQPVNSATPASQNADAGANQGTGRNR